MKVRMSREELEVILKRNRAKHEREYGDAFDAYKKLAVERLEKTIRDLIGDEPEKVSLFNLTGDLPPPPCHTSDYDRVLGMLKHHAEPTFELDERSYACYVEDEWEWKRSFKAVSGSYLG